MLMIAGSSGLNRLLREEHSAKFKLSADIKLAEQTAWR